MKTFEDWNVISKRITVLVFDEGACNLINGDVQIIDFPYLQTLTVKKNSFKNLKSLTIRNNTLLNTIVIEDGVVNQGGFQNVKTVVIKGNNDCI